MFWLCFIDVIGVLAPRAAWRPLGVRHPVGIGNPPVPDGAGGQRAISSGPTGCGAASAAMCRRTSSAAPRSLQKTPAVTFSAPGAVFRQTCDVENLDYPRAARGNLLESLQTGKTVTESKWNASTNTG